MMTGSSQYDAELQMFVHKKRELDPNRLCFLRWLAERGRLEQGPPGDSVEERIVRSPTDRKTALGLERLAVDSEAAGQGDAWRATSAKIDRRRDGRG
jgi:hypothetical protein